LVDQEHLEALDAMLWLGGSQRAARITFSNQSTVIRRARSVLSLFGGEIRRLPQGWSVQGADPLLHEERRIHQHFRFRGRRPLRLHCPYWSNPEPDTLLLDSWILNPADSSHCSENPLELLTERIIDACLLTPTQLQGLRPDLAERLVMVPVYSSTINLVAWRSPHGGLNSAPCRLLEQVTSPASRGLAPLHLFPFLPRSCRSTSLRWFEELRAEDQLPRAIERFTCGEGIPAASCRLAFLSPQMGASLPLSLAVDDTFERPYIETLVFLAEHAGESLMAQLADRLCGSFTAALASQRWPERNLTSLLTIGA
jgi:hypothetical protein